MEKQFYNLLMSSYLACLILIFMPIITLSEQSDTLEPLLADTNRVNWLLKQSRHYFHTEPQKVLVYAEEAFRLSEQLNYLKGKASAKSYLADVYANYNAGLAEEYQFEALKNARQSGDAQLIQRIINQTGIFYQSIGAYDKAEPYFRELLNEFQASGKDSISAAVMNNLAVGFRYRGMNDSSFIWLNKAKTVNTRFGNTVWLSQNYLNMGQYFVNIRHYDSALVYLYKSLSLTKAVGYTRNLSLVHARLARAHLLAGDDKAALEHARSSIYHNQSGMNKLREKEALELMKDIFKRAGRIDSAYFYLEKMVVLNDSMRVEEFKQDEAARQKRFSLEEEIQRQALAANELKASHTRKNFLIVIVILCAMLLVLVLAMILFRQRNKLMKQQFGQQLIQYENNKLQREVDFKNRELATHLLAMQKKNESLLRISEEIKKVQLDAEDHDTTLRNIVRNLTKTSEEQLWPEFEKRFKEIHGDFYKNLTRKHPNLSANELKMCAFMKMNMTTKEISAITSQSVETIKMGRYRLRTKLGLQRNENLVSYLNQI